jgi:hypothetical protein
MEKWGLPVTIKQKHLRQDNYHFTTYEELERLCPSLTLLHLTELEGLSPLASSRAARH